MSFLVSTAIPFSVSFQYPTARHFNIAVMVITFAISALAPALVSYFVADKATHSKNKSMHHYNGVIFGITSYWTVTFFGWFGFTSLFNISDHEYNASIIIGNVTPVIFTVMVMVFVAILYSKKRSNISVLQYAPLQIVLVTSIVGAFFAPYIFDMTAFSMAALVYFTIPVVATGIVYKVLAKYQPTKVARLCEALMALSIAWVSVPVFYSFFTFIHLPYQIESIPEYIVGLIAFIAYLYFRTHKR